MKNLKKIFRVIILITLILVLSAANMVHAQVTATISVGFGPESVAYDSGKREIFVTLFGLNNTVSVISDRNNSVVASVNVGNQPSGVAYDSGKSEIFVANEDDNTISIISDKK